MLVCWNNKQRRVEDGGRGARVEGRRTLPACVTRMRDDQHHEQPPNTTTRHIRHRCIVCNRNIKMPLQVHSDYRNSVTRSLFVSARLFALLSVVHNLSNTCHRYASPYFNNILNIFLYLCR